MRAESRRHNDRNHRRTDRSRRRHRTGALATGGAVCTFLGTVREITGDRRTVALAYEAYPEMARKKMAELEDEARRRWPVIEMALVHRVGDLELGEVSVVVAVSCSAPARVV